MGIKMGILKRKIPSLLWDDSWDWNNWMKFFYENENGNFSWKYEI